MDPTLPPLIQTLLEPVRYPGSVARVELMQTHISWVLLAGDWAYKIKKPLKLSFLDFSTLALRQQGCEAEVRLNRRYAADLYVGVLAIVNTPQDPRWDGAGEPIEYAVKMRRFDDTQRLDRVCQRGELTSAQLSDLAQSLVTFHAAAAVAPADSRFGSPAQILTPARDNFRDLARLLPAPVWAGRLASLQAWTEAQFQALSPRMAARKAAGRVRECHGDLHLANLTLIDGRVRLFDCLEFNEDLRWIDVANELAFTYVDLLAHGQPGLAGWLVDEVLSRNGDYEAAPLLRFYAVYRALVRAKVAALDQGRGRGDDAAVAAYIGLAERLSAPSRARLVITHGLSGCGKSVAAQQLLQEDQLGGTLRLRSDVERKRLFGLAPQARSHAALAEGLYAAEAQQRTYARLQELARLLLLGGWSVIVDATFLKRADRLAFQALARSLGVDFAILAPQTPLAQLRQRIQARAAQGTDASEATLAVLEWQRRALEPLQADEGPVLDASQAPDRTPG